MGNKTAVTIYDTNLGTYKKSNYLIKAKYSLSLISEKMFAISLQRLRGNFEDGGNMSVTIKKAELKRLLAKRDNEGNLVIDDGYIYKQMAEAADKLHTMAIYMQDDDNKRFRIVNIYNEINFQDSSICFEFNPNIQCYLVDLKDNFTVLNLPTMLQFTKNYSYRLYEILKSKCFYPKYTPIEERTDFFSIRIDLLELKFGIGVLDAKDEKVVKLFTSESPDYNVYEKAYDILKNNNNVKYDEWRGFKARVLEPAIEEINQKTDLRVEPNYVKGAKGKIIEIEFLVQLLKDGVSVKSKKNTNDEIEDFLDDMRFSMPVQLRTKELRSIAEASGYDMDKVKQAIKVYERSGNVDNVVGFLIAAIKGDYKEVSTKRLWNMVEKSDYGDMEELEKGILAN